MFEELRVVDHGESCVSLVLTDKIEIEAFQAIQALERAILAQAWPWVLERVPSYTGVTLFIDPLTLDETALEAFVQNYAIAHEPAAAAEPPFIVPVLYGGAHGPDLMRVVQHTGLSEAQVIQKHTENTCVVFMMGFMPGFGYFGGMDEALATPRLEKPRTAIAAGSVGIAGEQTGIYPLNSPGGWNIIGKTPLRLFDPSRKEPSLLKAGMRIQFKAIDAETFSRLSEEGGCA